MIKGCGRTWVTSDLPADSRVCMQICISSKSQISEAKTSFNEKKMSDSDESVVINSFGLGLNAIFSPASGCDLYPLQQYHFISRLFSQGRTDNSTRLPFPADDETNCCTCLIWAVKIRGLSLVQVRRSRSSGRSRRRCLSWQVGLQSNPHCCSWDGNPVCSGFCGLNNQCFLLRIITG